MVVYQNMYERSAVRSLMTGWKFIHETGLLYYFGRLILRHGLKREKIAPNGECALWARLHRNMPETFFNINKNPLV